MKKLILLSLFSLFAIASNAQTFFDGFESYKADSADYLYPKGPWTIDTTFWPYPHPAPMVRSTTRGVVPYEGDKMLEIRSVSNGDLAGIYAPYDNLPQIPAVEYSISLLVAKEDFVGQRVSIGFPFLSTALGVIVDFQSQVVTTFGYGGSLPNFDVPLHLGQWTNIKVRIDFSTKLVSYRVDNLLLQLHHLNPLETSKSARTMTIMSKIQDDLSGVYPLAQGAPGVFVDGVRRVVVPEPSTTLLLGGWCTLTVIRLRRCKHVA